MRAEHIEKSDQGGSTRVYQRQYLLPEGVDVDHIQSTLTKDGVLTVEAPAPGLPVTERSVPITYQDTPAVSN